MKRRKGMGGPLDLVHSVVVLLIAIFLISHGWGGNSIGPLFIVILGIALFILEIIAIAL